jgi:AcrR family transcriptional regulator
MSPLRGASAHFDSRLDDRLCDAAMALLIEGGIAALDLDDVDARAGLPPGTCRRRYDRFGKLLAAVLEQAAAAVHAEIGDIFDRFPGDPAAALVDYMVTLMGPARDRTRVVWMLLLDSGTRGQVTMYADALWAGWDSEFAARLRATPDQVRVAAWMMAGFVGAHLIHARPVPDRASIYRHVAALLQVAVPQTGCAPSPDGNRPGG